MSLPQIYLPGLAIDDPSITSNWAGIGQVPAIDIQVPVPIYLWQCDITVSSPTKNTIGPFTPTPSHGVEQGIYTFYADVYTYDIEFDFSLTELESDTLLFSPDTSTSPGYWPMNAILGPLDTVNGPAPPNLFTAMAAQGVGNDTLFGPSWTGGPLFPQPGNGYPVSYSDSFNNWNPTLVQSVGFPSFVPPFAGVLFTYQDALSNAYTIGDTFSYKQDPFSYSATPVPGGSWNGWQFSVGSASITDWIAIIGGLHVGIPAYGINPFNVPAGTTPGVGIVVVPTGPLPGPSGSDTGVFVHVNLSNGDQWNQYLTEWPTALLNYLQYRYTVGDVLMTLSNDQSSGTSPLWGTSSPLGAITFSDYAIGGSGTVSNPNFTIQAQACGAFCYAGAVSLPSPPADPFNPDSTITGDAQYVEPYLPSLYGLIAGPTPQFTWTAAQAIFITSCSEAVSNTINPFQPISQQDTLLNLVPPTVSYNPFSPPPPPYPIYPADTNALAVRVTETTEPYNSDITVNYRTVFYIDPSYAPSVTANGPPKVPPASSFFPGDPALALCGVSSGSFEKSMICLKAMTELDPWGLALAPYFWRSSDIDAKNNINSTVVGMPFLAGVMTANGDLYASYAYGAIGGYPVWTEPRGSYMTWNRTSGIGPGSSILFPTAEPAYNPDDPAAWFSTIMADEIWSQIKWGSAEQYVHNMLNPVGGGRFRGISTFARSTVSRAPVIEARVLASDMSFPFIAPPQIDGYGGYANTGSVDAPPTPPTAQFPTIYCLTMPPTEVARFDQSYGPIMTQPTWQFHLVSSHPYEWSSKMVCPLLNIQGGQIAALFRLVANAIAQAPSNPTHAFPQAIIIGPSVVLCAQDWAWLSGNPIVDQMGALPGGVYDATNPHTPDLFPLVINNPASPVPYWYPGGTSPHIFGPLFSDPYSVTGLNGTSDLYGILFTFGVSWSMVCALNNWNPDGSMLLKP